MKPSAVSSAAGRGVLSLWLFALLAAAHEGNAASDAKPLTLTVLAYNKYVPEEWEAKFEKAAAEKFGKVDLKVVPITDETKIFDLVRSGAVDVFSSTSDSQLDERIDYVEKRLTSRIDLNLLANRESLLPELLSYPAVVHPDGVHGVPFLSGPLGLMVDTAHVKPADATWGALVGAANAGRTVLSNAPHHLAYVAALICGLKGDALFSFEALNGRKDCRDVYETLVRNSLRSWKGNDKAEDFEGAWLGISWAAALKDLRAKSKTWEFVLPTGPKLICLDFWMFGRGLEKDSKKRSVAHAFVDFTLSEAYQRDVVVRGGSWEPANVRATQGMAKGEFAGRDHLRLPSALQDPARVVLKPLTTRDRLGYAELYRRTFERVKADAARQPTKAKAPTSP